MCFQSRVNIPSLTFYSPASAYWTLSLTPQKCINQGLNLIIAGGLNTLNDFLVVSFPIPTVLKLQLPFRQRIALIVLFAGGYVVCIAGGIRTYYTYHMVMSYDTSWEAYPNWISGSIELYIGVVRILPITTNWGDDNTILTKPTRFALLSPQPSRFSRSLFLDSLIPL